MSVTTPSPTLYVSGLNTKTKKPELRAQLYSLFTPYGRVIDVVAKKDGGMRGQAFVVFAEQTAATSAMRQLAGESFYDHSLRITYARTPSNATIARTDPSASREAAAIRAAKLTVSRAQGEYEALEKEREAETMRAGGEKRELTDEEGDRAAKRVKSEQQEEEEDEEEMEIEMEDDEDALPKTNGDSGVRLICSNLPPECTGDIMGALYSQYPGYASAKPLSSSLPASHPKPNPGAKSFTVSFASRPEAEAALTATSGYLMQPGWEMAVSIA